MSWSAVLCRHLLCPYGHSFSSPVCQLLGQGGSTKLHHKSSNSERHRPVNNLETEHSPQSTMSSYTTPTSLCNPFVAPDCLVVDRTWSIISPPEHRFPSHHHTAIPEATICTFLTQSDRTFLLGLEAIEAEDLQTLARHSRYFWVTSVRTLSYKRSIRPASNYQSPRNRQAHPHPGLCPYTNDRARLQDSAPPY